MEIRIVGILDVPAAQRDRLAFEVDAFFVNRVARGERLGDDHVPIVGVIDGRLDGRVEIRQVARIDDASGLAGGGRRQGCNEVEPPLRGGQTGQHLVRGLHQRVLDLESRQIRILRKQHRRRAGDFGSRRARAAGLVGRGPQVHVAAPIVR